MSVEKKIQDLIAARLDMGRGQYGPLTLGKKDWPIEALEEFVDGAIYLACELQRLRDARDGVKAKLPPTHSERLIAVAKAELGRGEQGVNNGGEDVARYKSSTVTNKDLGPWCASYASYCLKKAFPAIDVAMGLSARAWEKRRHGAKALYKMCGDHFGYSDRPEPGMLACWNRGAANSWTGHVEIVTGVDGNRRFETIGGNVGAFPSPVASYAHQVGEARLIGFARTF